MEGQPANPNLLLNPNSCDYRARRKGEQLPDFKIFCMILGQQYVCEHREWEYEDSQWLSMTPSPLRSCGDGAREGGKRVQHSALPWRAPNPKKNLRRQIQNLTTHFFFVEGNLLHQAIVFPKCSLSVL